MGPGFGFGGFGGWRTLEGKLLARCQIAYRDARLTKQTPPGTAEVIYPDHYSHRCVTTRVLDPAGDPFRGDITKGSGP